MLNHGASFQWQYNPRILVGTFYDVERATINNWAAIYQDALDQQQPGEPLLALYDMTHVQLHITPYMRQLAISFMRQRPDVPGCTAILMQPTHQADMLRGFLRLLDKPNAGRHNAVFFVQINALRWLTEMNHML